MLKLGKVIVYLLPALIYLNLSVCLVDGKHFPMWTSHYMRSTMGRALLRHMAENQQEEESVDHTQWYSCNRVELSAKLSDKFVESDLDADTEEFLENCHSKADAAFTQVVQHFIKAIFSLVMSATTVNGILNRGSMFVFSGIQFRTLLDVSKMSPQRTLLDLGAGDGKVTDMMQPHFDEVYVTEQSPAMRWRLSGKGYKLLDIETWVNATEKFDVVSCLNLLDRCDKPLTLLSNIRRVLKPVTGRVVIATVLPFSPCVESGSRLVSPSEIITVNGSSWEEQTASLVSDVFRPAGYEVERFTRLPYLCEGDIYEDYYILDDAVFVLKDVKDEASN